MNTRRTTRLLVEPPSTATGDIAFNLIIFFLVCASAQPDSGRKQTVPRSETPKEQTKKAEHIEVLLTRTAAAINGDFVPQNQFVQRLKTLLSGKVRPEDKIVVVKSKPEAPYHHWIRVTSMIEEAGGVITILREEEETKGV